VFVSWYASASHATRRNDSIPQDQFLKKWSSVTVKVKKFKAKERGV
jgi:hypothetical protein